MRASGIPCDGIGSACCTVLCTFFEFFRSLKIKVNIVEKHKGIVLQPWSGENLPKIEIK